MATSLTCADDAVAQPEPAAQSGNQACSESHLAKIAKSISDWRAVSPFLGLTEAEETAILGSNPHSGAAQKIAMLRKWKEKHGAKATYKRLCRVFDSCERADLMDKVKQLLAESGNSSDDEGAVYNSAIRSLIEPARSLLSLYRSLSTHCVCGQSQESLPNSTHNLAPTT